MVDLNKLIQKAGDDLPLVKRKADRAGAAIGKRRPWLDEEAVEAPETDRGQSEDVEPAAAQGFEAEPETAPRADKGLSGDTPRTLPSGPETTGDKTEDIPRTVKGPTKDSPRSDRRQLQRQLQRRTEDSPRTTEGAQLALSSLVRTRRAVVLYLARRARDARGLATDVVRVEDACKDLRLTPANWKKTAQRLARLGWFQIRGFDGAGGSIYTFTVAGWMAVGDATGSASGDSPGTTAKTAPGTNVPLSSGCKELEANFKTTTTSPEPSPWDEIDLTPLTEMGMRIGPSNVRSIAKLGSVTPEEVQDAVDMFAFDVRVNGKRQTIHGGVVAFLMGILRRGPYLPPQNYKSPQIERREAYLAWKRDEAEQTNRLNDEIIDAEFALWWGGLTLAERIAYAPDVIGSRDESELSDEELATIKARFREKTRNGLKARVEGAGPH